MICHPGVSGHLWSVSPYHVLTGPDVVTGHMTHHAAAHDVQLYEILTGCRHDIVTYVHTQVMIVVHFIQVKCLVKGF